MSARRPELCATVLYALPDGVLALDATGAIVEANPAAERLLGRARQALLGVPLSGLLLLDPAAPPLTLEGVGSGLQLDALAAGRALEVALAPAPEGALLTAVLREVTARRRAEADLASAKETAEAANAAKTRFLASMSHDLRTPMAAILGYADLLGTVEGVGEAERGEWVEQIRRSAEHLLALLNDILDLSKIEAGEVTLDLTRVHLFQAVSDVEALMAPLARERLLTLRVEWAGLLPEWIETDPVRLRQILVNLVSNAVKFTDRGGITIRVSPAGAEPPPGERLRLRLAVQDSGVGIAPQDQERLFDPFTPLAGRSPGGTGLGLNISRRLARLLGGDLRVESRPGAGSTFVLELDAGPARPLAELVDTTRLDLRDLRRRRTATRLDLRGVRVLVVDDHRTNRTLLAHILREPGALVTQAGDGEEALREVLGARAEGRPFDLVLMDMQMPVLDGYEATARLRSAGVATPIVALTAHAMTGDRDRCLAAGCDSYVAKPLVREQFLAELGRLLGRRLIEAPAPAAPGLVSTRAEEDAFRPLLLAYVAELPALADALVEAHRSGDQERLSTLCHQLAGSGGSYGFPQVSAAARRCEQQLRQGRSPSEVGEPLAELVALLRSASV